MSTIVEKRTGRKWNDIADQDLLRFLESAEFVLVDGEGICEHFEFTVISVLAGANEPTHHETYFKVTGLVTSPVNWVLGKMGDKSSLIPVYSRPTK